mmetsp:Transcript_51527/g.129267  ORF Transcript_51527/g.129267 Transcript_51527/m.129267 type:complete len:323 (-) Transcript_51527:555-1523(-)
MSAVARAKFASFRRGRTSARAPLSAAAAAITGDMRCVRPPGPCRPSKLRLDVEAQRSPGLSWSGFIPRHIEQPASRQSNPASVNTVCRPSASACCLTRPDPGTTMAYTPSDTFRLRTTAAAARRSSMRLFVHEPMNTFWILMSCIGVPGVRPIYCRARSMPTRLLASACACGSGTQPVMGTTSCGLVPHVTEGAMSSAAISTTLSKCAPSSLRSVFQNATAFSQTSPFGDMGRPFKYSNVVSSGATIPARAPASMAMLHMDMRASMDSAQMASPLNSMTWPVPPAVPMREIRCRMMSLEVHPSPSRPDTRTSKFFAFFIKMV